LSAFSKSASTLKVAKVSKVQSKLDNNPGNVNINSDSDFKDSTKDKCVPYKENFRFQGGPIITEPLKMNLYFYGKNFDDKNQIVDHIKYVTENLGGSNYVSPTDTFVTKDGEKVTTEFILDRFYYDNDLSLGPTLQHDDIIILINNAIINNIFEIRNNSAYYVITGPNVQVASYCGFNDEEGGVCGWHDSLHLDSGDIFLYGFVGADDNNPECAASCSPSVNGEKAPWGGAVDSAVATYIHELLETVSDPDLPGFLGDSNGEENMDICRFLTLNVQDTQIDGETRQYNTDIGDRKYLVQANLNFADKCCQNDLGLKPVAESSDASSMLTNSRMIAALLFSVITAFLLF